MITFSMDKALRYLSQRGSTYTLTTGTCLGKIIYKVKPNPNIKEYIQWQARNRDCLEAMYDGFCLGSEHKGADMTFEEFCRKVYRG